MAGKIIQLQSKEITTATSTVSLIGIDDNSTHIVTFNNLKTSIIVFSAK